jgi:fibronectin type 3 domain-containing protein
VAITTAVALPAGAAHAVLPGASAQLARAPYLSDLTGTSVRITWAMSSQSRGTVNFGPPGDCAASAVTSAALATPITVNGVTLYQSSIAVTGLTPGTPYCYRVFSGDSTPVDLLGTNPAPLFSTLEPAGGTGPFSFAVFGDWGDTTNNGVDDGALNTDQANVLARISESGARFALSTGDIGYPSGVQTNYGDLNQTGVDISGVFGPSYWAQPGQHTPMYTVNANHGFNATMLSVWPESAVTAASGGTYAMVPYPPILGTNPASYPSAFYAFDAGGVRFYMLDSSWSDNNVGTSTGGACGSPCRTYEVDQAAHWAPTSAQYQWLARDLAEHPGGIKMAAFHFPLRSDDVTEPGNAYLQNLPGSTGSIEELLHDNGVRMVFNGHAHDYQRNVAPPDGVISYVSGGGGAKLVPVGGHGCATTDAYAVGWSYSNKKGSACGAATKPTDDAQVFHFLKVTVDGSRVTVAPTDSLGRTFDIQTYDFGTDSTAPTPATNLVLTQPTTTSNRITWSSATDDTGVSAYDIYRNGTYLATTTPAVRTYTDAGTTAGAAYTYRVESRDLAGNTAAAAVSTGGTVDTTPPSAPVLTATATGLTTATLSWTGATDDVGVTGYTILRNGVSVASVPGTTTGYGDTTLQPGTAYTYRVTARDAAGNSSPASNPATVTTPADTSAPTAPGSPGVTSLTPTQVGLSWTASTDDVGVTRYDIVRDGTVVASVSGTTYTDQTSPVTTYDYSIRAYDAAGNVATGGTTTVTTPDPNTVFSDGFESGDLSRWTGVTGMTVQGSLRHTGSWAARETSTGAATSSYATLPAGYGELTASAWVYVVSRSTSATLFGFQKSTGASIVNVYVDTNGRVSLRNNAGSVTTYSTTQLAGGGWHRITLHAVVNGTASTIDVTMDGTAVPALTLTGQNLGTSPIARLQLGETSTERTYDIALDDVSVSTPPV